MTGDVLNGEERRHLPLSGTYNVRDIGGYATVDGRTTRWRTLIRSDSLHRLAPEAQQTLLDLGLRTMIDLRRPAETAQYPNLLATAPGITTCKSRSTVKRRKSRRRSRPYRKSIAVSSTMPGRNSARSSPPSPRPTRCRGLSTARSAKTAPGWSSP